MVPGLKSTLSKCRSKLTEGNVLFFLLMLLSFFIPIWFEAMVPIEILILVVWLVGGKLKTKFNTLKGNKYFYLVASFYLLHILSLLYTENLSRGISELEFKVRLISFPLVLFSTHHLNIKRIHNILWAFVLGAVLGFLYHSYIAYTEDVLLFFNKERPVVRGGGFRVASNRVGEFTNIAIIFLLYFFVKIKNIGIKLLSVLGVVLLLLALYLYNSKTSIIAFLMVFLLFSVYILFQVKIHYTLKIGILIFSFFSIYHLYHYAVTNTRFAEIRPTLNELLEKKQINEEKINSNNLRLIFWKTSWEIIKDNWLVGIGSGDVKDELHKRYKEKSKAKKIYNFIIQNDFSIHSSFLNTFVGLGIVGLINFLLIGFYFLKQAFRYKDILLISFIFSVYFYCMVDIYIGLNWGLFVFGLFYPILIYRMELNTKKEYANRI